MVDINAFYKGASVIDGDPIERISTSIRHSDKVFVQQRGFMVSKILKSAIAEMREYEEGGINFRFANQQLQKKIEKLSSWITKIGDAVEQDGDKKLKEKVADILR